MTDTSASTIQALSQLGVATILILVIGGIAFWWLKFGKRAEQGFPPEALDALLRSTMATETLGQNVANLVTSMAASQVWTQRLADSNSAQHLQASVDREANHRETMKVLTDNHNETMNAIMPRMRREP